MLGFTILSSQYPAAMGATQSLERLDGLDHVSSILEDLEASILSSGVWTQQKQDLWKRISIQIYENRPRFHMISYYFSPSKQSFYIEFPWHQLEPNGSGGSPVLSGAGSVADPSQARSSIWGLWFSRTIVDVIASSFPVWLVVWLPWIWFSH